jgi:hypothetical protein
MSKFLKVINDFLIEQDEENVSNLPPVPNDDVKIKPKQVTDDLNSKIPEPEDVALDIVKYRTLLKALREALYNASNENLEKQREISNIDVDDDDLDVLKRAEDKLMSILDQSESVPKTQE